MSACFTYDTTNRNFSLLLAVTLCPPSESPFVATVAMLELLLFNLLLMDEHLHNLDQPKYFPFIEQELVL